MKWLLIGLGLLGSAGGAAVIVLLTADDDSDAGSVTVEVATDPPGLDGEFSFTGVPGCPPVDADGNPISYDEHEADIDEYGSLSDIPWNPFPPCATPTTPFTIDDLPPGTYTSHMVDPAPDFDLTSIDCDDPDSATPSSGDANTRTAVFNIDPAEHTTCTFTVEALFDPDDTEGSGSAEGTDGEADGQPEPAADAINPFEEPDPDFENFPDPAIDGEPRPQLVPTAGPWVARNDPGVAECGGFSLPFPAAVPEFGALEVLDGGDTLVGTPVDPANDSVTMTVAPPILGRYVGSWSFSDQGTTLTMDFIWQVVTDEYIIGYLTSSFDGGGVSCSVYRSYDLTFAG